MPTWTTVPLWTVGQKIKAITLNLAVTAIGELQTWATARDNRTVHFVDVSRASGTQTITAGSFTTVTLPTVTTDAESLWDGTNNWYTVPETGLYCILSKVRPADGTSTSASYGQGVNTSNVDGPWFSWAVPASSTRSTLVNLRIASFNSGDQLRLYSYNDGVVSVDVIRASLNIFMIRS